MTDRRISHFVLETLLGEGAMGRVYRARDEVLDRPVAIKLLSGRTLGDPSFLDRFRREARLAAQLNHPNIATIYAFGEDEGEAYLAMEFVEGEDLADRLKRGPLSIEETRRVGRQAASALGAAHARGIIHRDIKPANLMITVDGTLKVMDFGVARRAGDTQLTMSGSLVGTANIMAPETINGEEPTPASDLFSLGCVLYECLTGRPAFPGTDLMAVLHQVMTREPIPVRELRPDVPDDLVRIVHGLLAKDPAARLGPAGAVEAALAGEAWSAPPSADAPGAAATMVAVAPSAVSAPRKRRARWVFGSIAAVVIVAGGFLGYALTRPSPRERATAINDRGALLLSTAGANVTPEIIATARGLFAEATRVDSTYAVPWNNLADLDRAAGRLEDAADGFRRAARLDPGNATAQANLGIVLEGLGRPRDAEQAYEAAMRLDAAHAVAAGPNNLGYLMLSEGRAQDALRVLTEAIDSYPPIEGNAPLWKNHGIAALAAADTSGARTSFERALALRPDYVDPLVGLAFVAAVRGDDAGAVARWNDAVLKDGNRAADARRTLSAVLRRDLPASR